MRIDPFQVHVLQPVLDDLRERLARTRWPDEVAGAGWDYGASLASMQDLVAYWCAGFDWRTQERALNGFAQFHAEIDGLRIHFVHERGAGPGSGSRRLSGAAGQRGAAGQPEAGQQPLPLILTHGWPSSFAEMLKIVPMLADPARFGGDPADAFDVVVPSLPGFGFSQPPARRGRVHVHALWAKLMTEVLGYRRFCASGGDIGAGVTSRLGLFYPERVAGIHLWTVDLLRPNPVPQPEQLSAAERDYLERVRRWEDEEGGYDHIQGTRPQTLAYGLNDSPAGLAAWIVEKFRAWSDCGGDVERCFTKDELLTNVTLYWVTGTINSSIRMYYESRHDPNANPLGPGLRIEVPTGIAMFPGEKDLIVPREWAQRCYNVTRWTDMPRGGHFPAQEQPQLLVEDIRAFFRAMR
jgi:pimeloyl-ACP methyl ester carboxylesterase